MKKILLLVITLLMTPLVISNITHAQLKESKSEVASRNEDLMSVKITETDNEIYTSKVQSIVLGGVFMPGRLNMSFDYTVSNEGDKLTFKEITNVSSWVTGGAYPNTYNWVQTECSSNISEDGSKVDFCLKGILREGADVPIISTREFNFTYDIDTVNE